MVLKYLIAILEMMLTIIASYNKLLYAIINTQYKITTTSSINFAKTHHFEIWSFLDYQEFFWGAGEGFGSQLCFTVPKILCSELQFCFIALKILWRE